METQELEPLTQPPKPKPRKRFHLLVELHDPNTGKFWRAHFDMTDKQMQKNPQIREIMKYE
jgi:hypothetical protein